MNKSERIAKLKEILKCGGELDKKLWDLGYWLVAHRIPYALVRYRLNDILSNWEATNTNPEGIAKTREWMALRDHEDSLEEELRKLEEENVSKSE